MWRGYGWIMGLSSVPGIVSQRIFPTVQMELDRMSIILHSIYYRVEKQV